MRLDRVFLDVNVEQLRAVLGAVAAHVEGFAPADIDDLCGKAAVLEPDDDILVEPWVRLAGESVPFVVNVFGSEANSNEVVFIVPSPLADIIQAECERLVAPEACRRMSALP